MIATPALVIDALERCRFTIINELELKRSMALALRYEGFAVAREVQLSDRDRIDFLIDDVGIEVKVKGAWRDVQRQLTRYAASPRVSALILVTVVALHKKVSRDLDGVPVHVHQLTRSGL